MISGTASNSNAASFIRKISNNSNNGVANNIFSLSPSMKRKRTEEIEMQLRLENSKKRKPLATSAPAIPYQSLHSPNHLRAQSQTSQQHSMQQLEQQHFKSKR
jgi:hypothetical protein